MGCEGVDGTLAIGYVKHYVGYVRQPIFNATLPSSPDMGS